MPVSEAVASLIRCMIAVMPDLRSSYGLRLIRIRPLLSVVLVPSTPMNDDRLSTSGSFRMTLASCCCRSAIAA